MQVEENFVIIDDVIPKVYQDILEKRILGRPSDLSTDPINWFYNPDLDVHPSNLTPKKEHTQNVGFGHVLVENGSRMSPLYDLFIPLLGISCDKIHMTNYEVVNARLFLQAPIGEKDRKNDKLHVDLPFQHMVFLYYINDSDGDTVFSNLNSKNTSNQTLAPDVDYEIIKRVTPKKGRGVFFNGTIYHASTKPSKNSRCVANFNIVRESITSLML